MKPADNPNATPLGGERTLGNRLVVTESDAAPQTEYVLGNALRSRSKIPLATPAIFTSEDGKGEQRATCILLDIVRRNIGPDGREVQRLESKKYPLPLIITTEEDLEEFEGALESVGVRWIKRVADESIPAWVNLRKGKPSVRLLEGARGGHTIDKSHKPNARPSISNA
jgi:hypothetical protein